MQQKKLSADNQEAGGTWDAIGSAAKRLFAPETQKCKSAHCKIESKWVGGLEECSLCKQMFCSTHSVGTNFIKHLSTANSVITSSKGACTDCLEKAISLPKNWQRSLIQGKCSHPGCDSDLKGAFSGFQTCKSCGQWFCSSHSDDASKISSAWILKKTKFPNASTICKDCAPSRENKGAWGDLKSAFMNINIVDRMTDTTLLFAFRACLIVLSLTVLYGVAPTTYTIWSAQSVSFAQKLWNLFLCGFAGVYLSREVIIEAVRRPKVRPYALTFSFMAIGYVGYKILFL